MNLSICILAGGNGKRMKSELPKVCVLFKGMPMIVHIINNALKLNTQKIIIITGKYNEFIQNTIKSWINDNDFKKLTFIIQEEALGTGHAVKCSIDCFEKNEEVLILNGDTPNLSFRLLNDFIFYKKGYNKLLISEVDNPSGYGRILMNNENEILKIIEEKDANHIEKKINKINSGIYLINSIDLKQYVNLIQNNNHSNEYYLTDIIELMQLNKIKTYGYIIDKSMNYEILGVNTLEQLNDLEKLK